jgi:tyrosine-protein kinase Etk/Wzc
MNESKDLLAINLASAFKEILRRWYILVISVSFMMLIAFFYTKYASKTYRVSSSIVLQTENQVAMGKGNNDLLRAFDIIGQDKNFNNEIFYLQSLPLVRDVLNEIDVRVSYFSRDKIIPIKSGFGLQDIYKSSPFIVVPEIGNSQPTNVVFHVDILNENMFHIAASGIDVELVDFNTERVTSRVSKFEIAGVYNFGSPVSNEHTSFRILLNSNYRPEAFRGKELFFQFNNLNRLVWSFKNNLAVNAEGVGSTLAHIVLKASNPGLGLDFLNKLIETYIDRNFEEANLLANKTIEHIERQLGDISDDLTLSERQMQNLRLNRGVMDIEDKSRTLYAQVQNFENRRGEVQQRLNHLRQMDDYFKQYKDSTRILAPSALGLNDPVLNGLISELTILNAEKQRMLLQDQTRNPRLATINIRIENLKDVIAENINFSLATIRNELEELNGRISGLNREFAVLPTAQRELLDIERRFNLNDAIYTNLLERRIQAQIVKASNLPNAKIIEPPLAGGIVSPNASLIYALFILAGMAVPSGFLIALTLLKNTISSKEDLRIITNNDFAGSIPVVPHEERLIINYPKSPLAESFFMLRSNIVYFLRGKSNKVILVTSSLPGEGKSFTAFNLATSFALSNSRTIFVEFDIRKPSGVMKDYDTDGLKGLSSYLINRASISEIIIKTEEPNLDIIQAGSIPPNPIALLSDPKTSELISELKRTYDFVILDTPPYGLLTDSFVLMSHADLTLYVTRLAYTKKNAFTACMEDLERKKLSNIYLLVNGEKENHITYGYKNYAYFKDGQKRVKKSSNITVKVPT